MLELHLIVLAIVQGITEFLPISSSAHLILVPAVTGWPDQGQVMDIAVHVGTLAGVMLYFWRDVWHLIMAVYKTIRRKKYEGKKLLSNLIIATIPGVVAGYLIDRYFYGALRSVHLIAWTSLIFGLLLYISDKAGLTIRRIEHMDKSSALVIGFAQILALMPGVSRSGICITAGRFLGFERRDAARFSMLMSIPIILAAATLKGLDFYQSGELLFTKELFMLIGLTAIAALIAIAFLMTWVRRSSYTPFVIYRILLSICLLIWLYKPFGWSPF